MVLIFVVLVVAVVVVFAIKRLRRGSVEASAAVDSPALPEHGNRKTALRLAFRVVGGIVVLLALIAFYDLVYPAPPKTLFKFGVMMYGHNPKGAAISLITRACDGGEARACTRLGEMYEDGVAAGLQNQDYDKARAAYTKACDGGDLIGCVSLGDIFDWGHGVTVDKHMALSYYVKACNGGNMEGCTLAGALYDMGDLGFTENLKQALYYYRKACDGGQISTCGRLGDLYEKDEQGLLNHVLAREAYQKDCDAQAGESLTSCTSLGKLLENGLGGDSDVGRAKKLYQEACDYMNPDTGGCLALGQLYESELKYEQARPRYQQACDSAQGLFSQACFQLARLYEKGLGGASDTAKARTLYQQACDGGFSEGCDRLNGKKPEESAAAAPKGTAPRARVASAASASSASSAAPVAALKHDEGAIRFYRTACEGGDARGCESMGKLYENGLGVAQDSSQARSYYQKACENGDSQGCAAAKK